MFLPYHLLKPQPQNPIYLDSSHLSLDSQHKCHFLSQSMFFSHNNYIFLFKTYLSTDMLNSKVWESNLISSAIYIHHLLQCLTQVASMVWFLFLNQHPQDFWFPLSSRSNTKEQNKRNTKLKRLAQNPGLMGQVYAGMILTWSRRKPGQLQDSKLKSTVRVLVFLIPSFSLK